MSSACSRRSGESTFPDENGGKPAKPVWLAAVPALQCRGELTRYHYSVMIDCSRNGVLRVESVKTLLRHLALMGNNMLQVRPCLLLPKS